VENREVPTDKLSHNNEAWSLVTLLSGLHHLTLYILSQLLSIIINFSLYVLPKCIQVFTYLHSSCNAVVGDNYFTVLISADKLTGMG